MAADKNGDGRLDAEELRALLKKHRGTFTDKEVEDLGEMFYAAKAGGSVSYDRFIHALDVKLGDEGEVGLDMGNHFKTTGTKHPLGVGKCSVEYLAGGHSVYSPEELDVKLTHTPPKTTTDKAAYYSTWLLRKGFDAATLWNIGELTQKKIMLRAIFLETIAAVPGFVGAMFRHFKALRTMERDGGWTNLLLEEARTCVTKSFLGDDAAALAPSSRRRADAP